MKTVLLFLSLFIFSQTNASAEVRDGNHRFGLTGGLIVLNNPTQTVFSISAEYEYQFNDFFGLGTQLAHVFASQSLTQWAVPTAYVHPLGGDWFVSASPIFYFVSGANTRTGARFLTRIPLNISVLTLVPTVGVDVIEGGPNYIVGLSFGI